MIRLCELGDIPDNDAIGIKTEHGEIVVLSRDGAVHAYRNQCPHLGIDLNFQPDVFMDLDGHYIQCANHGALFQVEDGLCVHGPCQGQSLQAVAIEVIGSTVWMWPAGTTTDSQ